MIEYFEKEIATETEKLKYILTTPTDFDKKNESLPLIVFLHGSGERGDDIEKLKVYCIPKIFTKDPDTERAITLSPLCHSERTWFDYKWHVIKLIDDIADEYNVDKDRITLCGISMGGFGTWEIAMTVPEKFAAIAPICGGGMSWRAWYLRNMPIRVYHGAKDDIVPLQYSEIMVNAIKAQGNNNIELTVYDDLSHPCWDRAFEKTDLVKWLATSKKDGGRE
ncbi:MAG: dienelactone hydrolase family protein [Clostridia bacterium]|nr:dienelactone hydrolase family protein [Clostridia bacterium]